MQEVLNVEHLLHHRHTKEERGGFIPAPLGTPHPWGAAVIVGHLPSKRKRCRCVLNLPSAVVDGEVAKLRQVFPYQTPFPHTVCDWKSYV